MRAVISDVAASAFNDWDGTGFQPMFPAVRFRGKIYVGSPRHLDAINLAFAGMTHQQKRRVANRIADGKEEMLFGSARGDGTEWEWNEEFQDARMLMYGFD